ncbi:MAG: hypothetical protein ACPGTP_05760 [Bacteroidia bacterium]
MKHYILLLAIVLSVFSCKEKDESELCELEDLVITIGECTSEGSYELTIDFKIENSTSDSFILYTRNATKLGTYHKSTLPLKLSNFERSGKDYDFLKICMKGDDDCCREIEFMPPNCEDCPCEITDLRVEVGECTSDSTYTLWVNFNHKNPGNEYFDLYTRKGNLVGSYKLSELPLKIEDFERSGFDDDFIKVCINDNDDCCEEIEFKPAKCDCELSELELTAGDCTSDSTYKLTIDFDYKNVSNQYFDVFIRKGVHIGYYKFADLPITLDSFPKSGSTWDFVQICENDNDDCCIVNEVKSPECPK